MILLILIILIGSVCFWIGFFIASIFHIRRIDKLKQDYYDKENSN